MAKAKKSDSPAAAAIKKKAPKEKAALTGGAPMVDTNLAAEAAARRVVAGLSAASPASSAAVPPATVPHSASFKHLKESLNKPAGGGLASMLDKTSTGGQKKTNTPYQGGKQTGRNQVFGADVNRSGVPRRTGGG